jgi:cell division septum initiation protein DivIVA
MTDIEADFEQLSPLVDDVYRRIAQLERQPYERATIASMLLTRLSVYVTKELLGALHTCEAVTPQASLEISEILRRHTEDADALIREAEQAYAASMRVQ